MISPDVPVEFHGICLSNRMDQPLKSTQKFRQLVPWIISIFVLAMGIAFLWPVTGGKADREARGAGPEIPQTTIPDTFWVRYDLANTYRHGSIHRAVNDFYRQRHDKPVWFSNGHLSETAGRFIAHIENAGADGLDPGDYFYYRLLSRFAGLENPGGNPTGYRAETDIMLTRAFFRYAHDLQLGHTSSRIPGDMFLDARHKSDYGTLLREMIRSGDVHHVVSTLRPQNPQYKRLADALLTLRRKSRGKSANRIPFSPVTSTPVTHPGSFPWSGNGWWRPGISATVPFMPVPRCTDTILRKGVEAFQSRFGLKANGIIDSSTVADLNLSAEELMDRIRVNMDRIRKIPVSFHEKAVVVNLPDYTLSYYDNGRLAGKMKVIIGDLENNTPMIDDSIEYLVFSPTWWVPEEISVKEMLPRIREDTGYLSEHHFRVYRGKHPVDPSEVNWKDVDEDHFPYRIVQESGPFNALGRVKFIFPNRRSIYLHDTPASYLFSKRNRHFSHGCVRLEKPRDLARWMIDSVDPTLTDSLDSYMNRDKPKVVFLPHKIPVYFTYATAWVDERGKLNFRKDVYGLDRIQEKAIPEPTGPRHTEKTGTEPTPQHEGKRVLRHLYGILIPVISFLKAHHFSSGRIGKSAVPD